MFFLCNLPFVILISIEYITLSFGQFCYDRKADGSTVRYCCANSEFRNEQCVECDLGFYTEAGGRCKPCKANHYGYKCIDYCSCTENQICDNVKGCLDVTVSISTEYITTDFTTFSTEATRTEDTVLTTAFVTVLTDETTIQQKQKNESHYTTARFIDVNHVTLPLVINSEKDQSVIYETTIQQKQKNESHYTTARFIDVNHVTLPLVINSEKDQSVISITKQQLIVFSLSAACFFLLLGLLFVCWKYKKKSKSRRITNLSLKDTGELVKKDNDKTADFNQDNKTNTSCSFESLYDEIDESKVIKSFKRLQIISQTGNIYMDVTDEPQIHTNIKDQDLVSSGYLSPVNGNEKNKHPTDNTYIDVISGSESPKSCQSTTSVESNYLTPVTPHQLDNCIGSFGSHSSLNGEEEDYLHPYTSVSLTQIDLLKENTITSKNYQVQEDNSYSHDEVNEHKYSHLYQQLNEGWETRTPTYMTTVSSSKQDSTGTGASTPSYISPSPFPKEDVTVTDKSAPSYSIPPLSPNEDVKIKEDSAPSCIIQCISPNKDVTVKEDNAPSSIIVCPSLKEGVTITGDSTTSCITSCPSPKEGITMTDTIHIDNSDPLLDISHRNENKHATCSIICDMKEHPLNCIHKVSLDAQEINNYKEVNAIISDKVTEGSQWKL